MGIEYWLFLAICCAVSFVFGWQAHKKEHEDDCIICLRNRTESDDMKMDKKGTPE